MNENPHPLVVSERRRGELAEVVAHVRERILTGALRPGGKTDQDATGEALGVSCSPVRDARVANEAHLRDSGLAAVESLHGRGYWEDLPQ